ncbi:MAG TPA: nucleotidyltransferase family protein [Leptospiraceae bacterium]|nr:nucleotidyltransferase family protein [Leptospiraceae bacterium]HNM06435.1 nucleotidyltransferase family protein [Leptospiraceae bacterium]
MKNLTSQSVKETLSALKPTLAEKYKIRKIGIFGSFADGTFNDTSDIDILVEFDETPGWDFFQLNRELESVFHRNVDLITPDALKSIIKENILNRVLFV